MAEDLAADLGGYAVHELDQAIQAYRRNAAERFYPRSGQLLELMDAARKATEVVKPSGQGGRWGDGRKLEYGDTESRPYFWWERPRRFWKPHWTVEQIPAHERSSYEQWKAAHGE